MAKKKTKFACTECGNEFAKWMGRCTGCGSWNTIQEEVAFTGKEKNVYQSVAISSHGNFSADTKAEPVGAVSAENAECYSSGSKELDRVLGGGIFKGAVVLLAGSPGFGKSTILSQVSSHVGASGKKVLYVSGEESKAQGKKRFEERLKLGTENVFLQHSKSYEEIQTEIERHDIDFLIVDSIQMIGTETNDSQVGGPSQVKAVTAFLVSLAKQTGISIFIVGQVTKDNNVAGPRMLEHMVDTFLFLEGDSQSDLRLIRPIKNRFGSTLELGVFEMSSIGLLEVTDPSRYSLSDRPEGVSGSVVTCINDSRPILVEMQALVTPPVIQNTYPKRRSLGYNSQRLDIVLGVLEKRLANKMLAAKDVLVNSAGGIKITNETSADLAVALAIYSSDTDKVLDKGDSITLVLGEIGLTGEVRPVANCEQLIREAIRCSVDTVILPRRNYERLSEFKNQINMQPVKNVQEAINICFS